MLGAGLVEVPPVLARDPAAAVLADPKVPENRRFCGNCGQLVGQSRDGRPGLADGFCRHCGARFSFTPKLQAGDVVADQYEVKGCLAFGGLGLDLPCKGHHPRGPLGRPQGPAEHRLLQLTLSGLPLPTRKFLAARQARQHRRHLQLRNAR